MKHESRLPDRPFLASPLAGASGLVLMSVPVMLAQVLQEQPGAEN